MGWGRGGIFFSLLLQVWIAAYWVPCRFRLINTAAREALVKGGFARTDDTGKAKAKGGKGRK